MTAEVNKQKFENIFRTEYKKLLNYVKKNFEERFFGSTPEDIIQDVALGILSKLDIDFQVENLAGYVYRSLKNKTIDINRQKSITESANNDKDNNALKLNIDSISEENEKDFLDEIGVSVEQVHECISKLKPDEQAIIMLTEFEGRTFAELSGKWNVPVGTLLSRKHRALAKLYKLLIKKENQQTIKIRQNGNKQLLLTRHEMAQ